MNILYILNRINKILDA